ncbi:MAG TPA: 30S ribosomal protein S12 methylthiotransferase RimO [bacterium]|nr:30S ribosomal protein S12 methylthiotransferase RimO [bacterium]
MTRTLAVINLGCAKNLVDAEVAVGALGRDGYELTLDEEGADVVVVNTCAFVAAAREEAREVVADVAARMREDATLAITGCFPQLAARALADEFERADVILGVNAAAELAEAVRRAQAGERVVRVGAPRPPLADIGARPRLTAPHVSFLKIAEGCDHPCTFCTIPRLRGRYRSRDADDVVREAEIAAERGVAELVLLAQDTSRYGEDTGGADLAALLRRLAGVGVPWLRVLYLHPGRLSDELLGAFAELDAVVNYFDVPLQHAEPRLLAAMGRPAWPPEETLARLERIRELVPGAALRTTFIVGFPGETDDDVEVLAEFVRAARFDHVGVFEYSPEEGTPAAALAARPSAEAAAARRELLMLSQQEIVAARYREMEGQAFDVLVDRVLPEGVAVGRTYFQGPETDPVTLILDGAGLEPGRFARVEVQGHEGYELVARPAEAARRA